jgi:hypothetical protein
MRMIPGSLSSFNPPNSASSHLQLHSTPAVALPRAASASLLEATHA